MKAGSITTQPGFLQCRESSTDCRQPKGCGEKKELLTMAIQTVQNGCGKLVNGVPEHSADKVRKSKPAERKKLCTAEEDRKFRDAALKFHDKVRKEREQRLLDVPGPGTPYTQVCRRRGWNSLPSVLQTTKLVGRYQVKGAARGAEYEDVMTKLRALNSERAAYLANTAAPCKSWLSQLSVKLTDVLHKIRRETVMTAKASSSPTKSTTSTTKNQTKKVATCSDESKFCAKWSFRGWCKKPRFASLMKRRCKKTCGLCKTEDQ